MKQVHQSTTTQPSAFYRINRRFEGTTGAEAVVSKLIRAHHR